MSTELKSKPRGRLAKRTNVSMTKVTSDKARIIGGGNVSRGLAIAIKLYEAQA